MLANLSGRDPGWGLFYQVRRASGLMFGRTELHQQFIPRERLPLRFAQSMLIEEGTFQLREPTLGSAHHVLRPHAAHLGQALFGGDLSVDRETAPP